MIILVTNWFKIAKIPANFDSKSISNVFHSFWLAYYPHLYSIIYDNRKEFKKYFKYLVKDYYLKNNPSIVKNPQSN